MKRAVCLRFLRSGQVVADAGVVVARSTRLAYERTPLSPVLRRTFRKEVGMRTFTWSIPIVNFKRSLDVAPTTDRDPHPDAAKSLLHAHRSWAHFLGEPNSRKATLAGAL